jgi:hypothetical protein
MIKDYGRSPDEVNEVAEEKWTTDEMQRDFTVHSFSAPFITVTRKSDGTKGTLEFGHSPRIYFNFVEG